MQGVSVACVQYKKAGKIYSFSYSNLHLVVGDRVIITSDRGLSLATVVKLRFSVDAKEIERLKPILRKATAHELSGAEDLSDEYVTDYTKKKVKRFKLKMTILKSEVQFAGNKVLIYFSAPGRVDFRDLVKELASGLKTRVELKQVGARDETKLLGGLGICGREYCCSSFLREFVPVSIRMAKNQNLALNPNKVSGGCGRLLCCLTYENDTYTELRHIMPPRGAKVLIEESQESARVLKSDLLNQLVAVETEQGEWLELPLKEIKVLN